MVEEIIGIQINKKSPILSWKEELIMSLACFNILGIIISLFLLPLIILEEIFKNNKPLNK